MRLFVTTMILVSNACGTAQRNQSDVLSPGQAGAKPSREIALHFFDAMTGKPLEGAQVSLLGQTATTHVNGQALLPWPAKLKTQEDRCKVRVSRAGYVTSDLELQVISGSLYSNRFSISPTLEPKRVRVVLDWGASPADLDAHLVERKRFHISSRHMKYWRDVVRLDRADTDGHGPETITLDRVKTARNYAFMVHDYSHHHNSDAANFEAAGATVQLYMDGRLKAQFRPPPGPGNLWNVFSIRQGQLIIENQVSRLR